MRITIRASFLLLLTATATAGTRNEELKLEASNGMERDHFGGSQDLHGDRLIVGAASNSCATCAGPGWAYVYDTTTWTELAQLQASDGFPGDGFGWSVGISEERAIVGAYPATGTERGAYLFDLTTGLEIARLQPSDGGSLLGWSVAISDEVALAVGNAGDLVTYVVYVFDATSGVQVDVLVPQGTGGHFFGQAIAVDGTLAIVGARGDDDRGLYSGSAYLFDLSSGQQLARLVPEDPPFLGPHAFSSYATSVAISGTTAIVGAYRDDVNGTYSGAAFLYDATNGALTGMLAPDDGEPGDFFGGAVAIDGTTAVVGALGDDDSGSLSGSAYVFDIESGVQVAKLHHSDGEQDDLLGASVAVRGTTAFVGAPEHFADERGAVYVFDASAAPSFCDGGDGSLAACPCSNPGLPETGCDLPQATGGVGLELLARETSPSNRVTWQGTGYPLSGTPASIVLRAGGLDPAAPVPFGDGLRCIGTPLVRLGAAFAIGGTSVHTHGHGSAAGAGDFHYQLWFRSTPAMYCTPDAFNLSNGRTLSW